MKFLRYPFVLWVLGIFVVCGITPAGIVSYLLGKAWREASACDLTSLSQAQEPMIILGQDRSALGEIVSDNRIIVSFEQISPALIGAVTAAEDKTFASNWGFDLHGTMRAFVADLRHKHVIQGGSTITQQLAKHMIDEHGRSFWRKLVELEVAWRLTRAYSKNRILELYLNEIYWGSGFYGIEAASEGYFHIHASELNDAQSALLAGLIRAPNANSPFHNLARSIFRQKTVLRQMRETGYLTEAEYRTALREPLGLQTQGPPKGLNSYAVASVSRAVDDLIASGDWYKREGVEAHTTFIPELQKWLETTTSSYLDELRRATAYPVQAAVLIVDNATGGVLAETGGYAYCETAFDRNWMMERPTGTMLFPMLLSAALSDGHLNPATLVDCRPVNVSLPEQNGPVTSLPLQDLISVGDNHGMARLAAHLGLEGLHSVFSPSGPDDVRRIADGSRPTSPADWASYFIAISSHGAAPPLHCLEAVTGKNGRSYTLPISSPTIILPAAVADQVAATLASGSMAGLAETLSPGRNHGIGYGGFSVNSQDAWYAGTDGVSTIAVWVGCDQAENMIAAGNPAKLAFPLWQQALDKTKRVRQTSDQPLVASPNLQLRIIRRSNGLPVAGLTAPGAGMTMVFVTPEEAQNLDRAALVKAQQAKSSDWQAILGATIPPISGSINRPLYAAWKTRSSDNPLEIDQVLPALRPSIVTADGQWIAASSVGGQEVYTWPTVDSAVSDQALLEASEAELAPLGVSSLIAQAAFSERRFAPLVLNPFISPFDLPNIIPAPHSTILPSIGRYYPNGSLYAHLVGTLREKRRPSQVGKPQRDEVFYPSWEGVTGLEAMVDHTASPREGGLLRITCDPFGYAQFYTVVRPVPPAPVLTTTLIHAFQTALSSAMTPVVSGAAVILDTSDGAVAAMISKPDFDPNALLQGGATSMWQQLEAGSLSPMMNKSLFFQGPPGSTFKVVTSLVALRSGALQTNENIPLGSISLPGVNYNFAREHGDVSFREALAQSRDSYFMRVGLRVGAQALIAGALEMGLGTSPQFPLGGGTGLVPSDAFMLKNHQRPLSPGDAANLSIGQGDLTVTPMQMAILYSSLDNGGTRWRPHLWAGETPVALGKVDLPPGVAQAIMAGLHQVTIEGTGTAAHVEGVDTWGKTGTAQVGTKAAPRQLAWFCGGFVYEGHRYAAAILTEGTVDELIFGGGTSAVIFGQTLRNLINKTSVPAKLIIAKATGAENNDSIPIAPLAPNLETTIPSNLIDPQANPNVIVPNLDAINSPRAEPVEITDGVIDPATRRALPVTPVPAGNP